MLSTSNTKQISRHLVSLISFLCISLLLLFATSSDGATQSTRKPKELAQAAAKSCSKPTFDSCAAILFVFGRRDVYLPKNFQEMTPHCQEEFEAEDCIKTFARKCLGPFERQVTRLLILGAGQVLRKRCSQEGTKEYLTHYKCIKQTLPQMHDAMDQLIYSLMNVNEGSIQEDLKIPVSCCAFARFQQTAASIVRRQCADFDPTASDYIGTKMIRGYTGDVLDLSCQGYELGAEKCSKLTLPSGGFEFSSNGTLVKQANVKLPRGPKPNSVVLPFLDIFTNL